MHSPSDRRLHYLVIGGICSILSKGHPVEERYEEYSELLNLVMKDSRMPIYNKVYTPYNSRFSFHIYAAYFHLSSISIMSIGYCDTVPMRVVEYIVGIFCQIVDGIIWANLSAASAAHCPRATLSRSASMSTPACERG